MPDHLVAKLTPCCALALTLVACGTHGPAPQGDAPGGRLPAWRVIGTEPFWNIRVQGQALHFTTLEDQAGRHLEGRYMPEADGARYLGEDQGAGFELQVRREPCSDGMSDTAYAFAATFRIGETTYRGCAQREDAPAPAGGGVDDPR